MIPRKSFCSNAKFLCGKFASIAIFDTLCSILQNAQTNCFNYFSLDANLPFSSFGFAKGNVAFHPFLLMKNFSVFSFSPASSTLRWKGENEGGVNDIKHTNEEKERKTVLCQINNHARMRDLDDENLL